MSRKSMVKIFLVLFVACGAFGSVVAQMPNPYGPAISLENAKKAAAPALAEAAKNNWTMAVAIVGPAGTLVYYEKMDNTQIGSAEVAIDKARTAALFKRPTKAFQDAVSAGGDGLRVLGLKGAVPILLGMFILSAGVAHASRIYAIIFIVVLVSVLLQGSLVPALAAAFKVPMRLVDPEPWAAGIRLTEEPLGRPPCRRWQP